MNAPLVFHTRPPLVAEGLTQALSAAGLTARPFSVLELEAEADFAHQFNHAPQFDALIWVSPSAVALTWPILRGHWQQRLDKIRDFNPPTFYCVGAATAQALTKAWLADPLLQQGSPFAPWPVVCPSAGNDSAALLAMPPFSTPQALQGLRVGVLAGTTGRPDLVQTLQNRGAKVTRFVAYRAHFVEPNWADFAATCAEIDQAASKPAPVFFVVSSSQIAQHLIQTVPPELKTAWLATPMMVLHPRILSLLQQAGATAVYLAEPNDAAVVQAIVQLWHTTLARDFGLNRLQ
jgi:uroporphyrinogen-III synthase